MIKINKRLLALAELVRSGVTLYDIGTDHGYLPVYLIGSGKISAAVASDIAAGPLLKAVAAIRESGFEHNIKAVLSDGLKSVKVVPPCDIVIAGMGGELISDIISGERSTQLPGVRLVLQPMTRAEKLRGFLSGNGYEITAEALVRDDRLYQIICCEYTGKNTVMTDTELLLGRENIKNRPPLFREFAEKKYRSVAAVARGKQTAGIDCAEEMGVLDQLRELIPD